MRRESVVATVVRRSVSNDNFSPSSTHYDSVAHGRSLGCERARGSVDCGSRASSPGRVWRIERRRHHRRQHAGIDRSRGDTLLRGRGSRLRASARSGTAFRRAASARCDLPRRRRAIQSLYGPMVAGRPRPAACPGRRSCTSRLRRGREPWTRSRATNLTSRRLRTEDFPFRRESPSADSLPQLSRDGARGLSCIQHWDAGACCFADATAPVSAARVGYFRAPRPVTAGLPRRDAAASEAPRTRARQELPTRPARVSTGARVRRPALRPMRHAFQLARATLPPAPGATRPGARATPATTPCACPPPPARARPTGVPARPTATARPAIVRTMDAIRTPTGKPQYRGSGRSGTPKLVSGGAAARRVVGTSTNPFPEANAALRRRVSGKPAFGATGTRPKPSVRCPRAPVRKQSCPGLEWPIVAYDPFTSPSR